MPQLNLYVPEETARLLRQRAKIRGVPLSKYLASIIVREAAVEWPAGYFRNTIGAWRGELRRPRALPFDKRESF